MPIIGKLCVTCKNIELKGICSLGPYESYVCVSRYSVVHVIYTCQDILYSEYYSITYLINYSNLLLTSISYYLHSIDFFQLIFIDSIVTDLTDLDTGSLISNCPISCDNYR